MGSRGVWMVDSWPAVGGTIPSGCGTRLRVPVCSSFATLTLSTPSSRVWPGVPTGASWLVGGSPDGTRLASGGGGQGQGGSGELFVWDARSGAHSAERLQALSGHTGIVFAIAWSELGDLLVSGGSDGMLRWWDVRHGECVMMREAHQGAVQSLRISSDGRMLASCGDDGAITLWDLEDGCNGF